MDEVVAATGGYQYNVLRRLEAKGWMVRRRREGRVTRYWAVAPSVRAFELKVAPNGQTTLPKEARERLGVPRGGRLSLRLEPGDHTVIAPVSIGVRELRGILPKPKTRATLADIEEGIARGATKT
ncbi:MAG: AbrB/MazE/SpoVT family DNA-binding domain-containing protein [Rhizomicrobium sp.]